MNLFLITGTDKTCSPGILYGGHYGFLVLKNNPRVSTGTDKTCSPGILYGGHYRFLVRKNNPRVTSRRSPYVRSV